MRNRYNQVPHLTQDTNEKVTNSQLDATNERQEVSPFPAGYHKAHINRLYLCGNFNLNMENNIVLFRAVHRYIHATKRFKTS